MVAEPPYYGQTTHFTCGAVTALIAAAHAGMLPKEALDREAELTHGATPPTSPRASPWDWASPRAEPGRRRHAPGLAVVATRRAWPSSPVTVHLDVDRPVLLDHCSEHEREWRAPCSNARHTGRPSTSVSRSTRAISR